MSAIEEEVLSEYRKELEQLADEKKLGDADAAIWEKRSRVIKDRIIAVADVVQGTAKRMVFPMEGLKLQWDRRVTRTGGGLSIDGLQNMIGKAKFKKMVMVKVVSYEVSEEKFLAAREAGLITDDHIRACTVEPRIGSSIFLSKYKKVEEGGDDEYNDSEE